MNLLSLTDLSQEAFQRIVDNTVRAASDKNYLGKPMSGLHFGLLFEKPSTRTRISFEVAVSQLGGYPLVLSSSELQISRGESIADTARVLERYIDGIMVRTFDHNNLIELAKYSKIPVINGLSDLYHPCQALADIATIKQNIPGENPRIVFLGDGASNVSHSLILAAAMYGARMVVASPEEYRPDLEVIKQARAFGCDVELTTDVEAAAENADVLYTDVWVSMGEEKNAMIRKKKLSPYQLNKRVLQQANKTAIVMHCLPAEKGLEISEDIFESGQSRIFDQAENRLHAQKALLAEIYS